MKDAVVDFHCHVVTPTVEAAVQGHPQKIAELENAQRSLGPESAAINLQQIKELGARLTSVPERLRQMDAMGVDVQVLSPSPSQYYYWAEREVAAKLVRLQNEDIARISAEHPDRFTGLANVSLQHPDLAAEQLDYAVRVLGLRGAEVSTAIGSMELGDRRLACFWAKAEELGCILFIHPWGTSLGDRVNQHYLANIIGQPLETTIALSHLIFGGLLDTYPGVMLCAAHGGGYLPSYIGRSDHAFANRKDASKMKHPPSHYLKRMFFDTLLYTPEGIRHLVNEVGPEHVVMGTDYPFDMGHYDPVGLINAVPDLSPEQRTAILGRNAQELLASVRAVKG